MMQSFGGRVADDAGRQCTINSPETANFLGWIKGAFDDGQFPPSSVTWDGAGDNNSFTSGESLFIVNTGSVYQSMKKDDPDLAESSAYSALPAGPKGQVAPVDPRYRVVPTSTSDAGKVLAQDLFKTLADDTLHGRLHGKCHLRPRPEIAAGIPRVHRQPCPRRLARAGGKGHRTGIPGHRQRRPTPTTRTPSPPRGWSSASWWTRSPSTRPWPRRRLPARPFTTSMQARTEQAAAPAGAPAPAGPAGASRRSRGRRPSAAGKEARLGLLLALPAVAVIVILIGYPTISSIWYSFTDRMVGSPGTFIGLAQLHPAHQRLRFPLCSGKPCPHCWRFTGSQAGPGHSGGSDPQPAHARAQSVAAAGHAAVGHARLCRLHGPAPDV